MLEPLGDRVDVREVVPFGPQFDVAAAPIDRYLEKARETGVLEDSTEPLFRTPDGAPIDPESFDLVHQRGRLAQVNMSSQGGICDGLREARERRFGGETTDAETADD